MYLYLRIKHFTKEYKFTLGQSMLDLCWQTLDNIIRANLLPNEQKAGIILKASTAFDCLKTRVRMGHELKQIPPQSYAFLIKQNTEIGIELNAWLKWAKQFESKLRT